MMNNGVPASMLSWPNKKKATHAEPEVNKIMNIPDALFLKKKSLHMCMSENRF
jgi:hypothetical protein